MPVRLRVVAHLGVADDALDQLPVLIAEFPRWQHISLQTALDSLLADPDTTGEVLGVPIEGFHTPSLAELLVAPDVQLGPIAYTSVAAGVDTTLPCMSAGLLLLDGAAGRLSAWVRMRPEHGQMAVEVKAESLETAKAFLADVQERMADQNPYRGNSLTVHLDSGGAVSHIDFRPRPHVERDDLVLPPGVLDAIDAHAVGIGRSAERLRAAGRHLKRGLLLHGPPGTGKTHTVRYITSCLPEATLFVLTGEEMLKLKQVSSLLADMAPVVVVLDDVDLVAEERQSANNGGAALFDLLDAMDGMREDLDVLFVCTSNRANNLEQAIAARPGRIDQAIEIPTPDADCRRHLLELYANGIDLRLDDVDAVIHRTEGVTASFVKELLRRATLKALADDESGGEGPPVVRDRHVDAALDELLDPSHPLYRALLGVHDAEADAAPDMQAGAGGASSGI